MLAKFFIERPVPANVIALVTLLLGGVAMVSMRFSGVCYAWVHPAPGNHSSAVADCERSPAILSPGFDGKRPLVA
jgi:hypothetical protein